MKTNSRISYGNILTGLVMCFCLLLLTGANFIQYPGSQSRLIAGTQKASQASDEESPVPVEEKSSSKTGLTIQEEYIHSQPSLKILTLYAVATNAYGHAQEKLPVVYYECIAPPPRA